jgi:hypothetical protein
VVLLALVTLIPRAACAQGPIWTLDFVSSGTAFAAVRSPAVLTARVRLSGSVAPAGGFILALTSSDPRVLSMPASVTVPAGRSEALFEIRAAAVSTAVNIRLSATGGGRTQAAIVTVTAMSASAQAGVNTARGASAGAGASSASGAAGEKGAAAGAASTTAGAVTGGAAAAKGGAAGAASPAAGGAAAEKGGAAGATSAAAGGAAAAKGGAAGAAAGAAAAEKGAAAGAAAGGRPGGAAADKASVTAGLGSTAGSASTSAALSVLVAAPNAISGQIASFVIQARTPANTSRTTGGDAFVARLSGPQAAPVSIKDAGDGTYVGSFVVSTTGTYTLHVLLAGVPIAGSPSAVSVK